jgi:hypothetical protein
MARIWQVRYRESITEVRSALARSPKDRQGRSLVYCGGASALWWADALQEDAGLRVTLWPVAPHEVAPSLSPLELPMPLEVIE